MKMRHNLRRTRRGFTLIELLVVLVILALLAGIVLPRFLQRGADAQRQAAVTQIAQFKQAINLYMVDNQEAPTTQQGLDALIQEPTTSPRPRQWKGPYMEGITVIPPDPWGNEYIYQAPGPNGEDFFIASGGKDGREGGSDQDADITSTDPKQ